jgi:K+-sensing histidine kinase KdpD
MPGATGRWRSLGTQGLRPGPATLGGAAGVTLVTLAVAPFGDSIGHATQALLLVLPVVAAAVVGGRRPAQIVAALATLMFTLVLPPVGTLRVRFTEDVVALVVFFAVAFSIGGLVAYRIETFGRLERERAALLRSVSHDLRTPLAAIRAAVSELEDPAHYDAAGRARLLRLVDDEAARLDRLVANRQGLDLARRHGDPGADRGDGRRRPVGDPSSLPGDPRSGSEGGDKKPTPPR